MSNNLIESVVNQIAGSGGYASETPYQKTIYENILEKFNPTSDKEFIGVVNMLKLKGDAGGSTPDEVIGAVYDKFLNSKFSEGQAKKFMNMMMGFASKGYAPKLKSSTKGKLKKFLSTGMHLEQTDLMMKEQCISINELHVDHIAEYILQCHGE